MEKWQIALIIGVSVTAVVTAGSFIYLNRSSEEVDPWSFVGLNAPKPPFEEPRFSDEDTDECRVILEGYYESAYIQFEKNQ